MQPNSISVMTVEVKNCRPYLEVLIDSISARHTYVKEILIAVTDADDAFDVCKTVNGIRVRRFGVPMTGIINFYGHALGMHACLKRATSDYVLFTDPDVFWYTGVDKLFLEMMHLYDLNYVGVSHHNAVNQCFYFFPYIIQSMVRKDTLPAADWLHGHLYFNSCLTPMDLERSCFNEWFPAYGKWLIPGPLASTMSLYPNKDAAAIFDIGCNMWLWNEEKKGKWLAFQTRDCKNYTMGLNRCNFKCPKLPMQNLLYHHCDSAKDKGEQILKFRELYEQSK